MLSSKKILLVLVLLILSGCISDKMAAKFLPTVANAGNFKYGGWIVADLKLKQGTSESNLVSGELIAINYHQLFILDTSNMHIIPDSIITSATLYMYKTQPGVFAVITILTFLPNLIAAIAVPEHAGFFIGIGCIPLITGMIFAAAEGGTKRNQLIFPARNSLSELNKYARFPQGIPAEMDISQLKLPPMK